MGLVETARERVFYETKKLIVHIIAWLLTKDKVGILRQSAKKDNSKRVAKESGFISAGARLF